MAESSGDLLTLSKRTLVLILLGTAVSQVLMLTLGTPIGYLAYPLLNHVFRHANRAVGAVAFLTNALCAAVVLWVLSICIRNSVKAALLMKNRTTFEMARFVTVVSVFLLALTFIFGEARDLIIINAGNLTQFDFHAVWWSIILNVVIPAVVLVLLLLINMRVKA